MLAQLPLGLPVAATYRIGKRDAGLDRTTLPMSNWVGRQTGERMKELKWVGAASIVAGLVFWLFALLWTEWVQFFVGASLVVVGAAVWRALNGGWPLLKPSQGP